ncbi:hypothetical protein COU78_01160 [Candidatus Peregrinibacteria bacterium CG10_big_fil_rev_8_21_14_0_10_49_24]|nr:MAG: hypothetical protein COV83_04125 [Candidatus Peregrinibacteria bacterium CG11_big_fil_rev_8_21_14_0_20_49_14]PIR51335.1 MAG: hypothetical protein COU78_01160 [Candidatus Peregrinibacteria bacterium CG10_big_fil_rev_8_21_14_0_10_49_24]PJA68099.1 MAG: hypothetical protein CO157_00975 [Candidatus Peregrinibacteria bacterium CG_4_9_14_3_um_filter_49_12]
MFCCLRHNRFFIIILAVITGIIGAGFLYKWDFVTQNWPFFLLLLCPLMHTFGGHSHGVKSDSSHADSHNGKNCH